MAAVVARAAGAGLAVAAAAGGGVAMLRKLAAGPPEEGGPARPNGFWLSAAWLLTPLVLLSVQLPSARRLLPLPYLGVGIPGFVDLEFEHARNGVQT